MITGEKKKQIESLLPEEMLYEINIGKRSRFQREKFAYLQACYQKRIEEEKSKNFIRQNKGMDKATNTPSSPSQPAGTINLRNFAFIVATIVFASVTIWVLNHYFNIRLF